MRWLGVGNVMARLAEGAAGAVVEKGYGAGAAAAADLSPACKATW